jgi:membrane protease YdiL (CAAX protease family)
MVGMFIMLLYAATRFFIYRMFPIVWSVQTSAGVGVLTEPYPWWVRDTIMDIPRVVGFGLSLAAGWYFWGIDALGWHARCAARGLIWGAVGAVLIVLEDLFRTEPFAYPTRALVVLALSSVVVALFEETLFRGVFFNALHDLRGARWAVLGSTALFTVFHVQARPVEAWPGIFAGGLLYAVLRSQGVGLVWLALSHAAGDGIVFLFSRGPARVAWWPMAAWLLQLGIPAIYYFSWTRRTRRCLADTVDPPGSKAGR